MKVINYDKAVRDRIPEIIQVAGKECTVEQASAEKFLARLLAKLSEEVAECQEEPCLEELADIVEVVRALTGCLGHSWDELERIRQEKAASRGVFERRLVLKEVRE